MPSIYPLGTPGLTSFGLAAFGVTVQPLPVYPDLIAAVVARLRAQGVGEAMGETGSPPDKGTQKIWSDEAMGSPKLPWLTIEEHGEDITPESPAEDGSISYVGPGELHIGIYANPKTACRTLRRSIVAALNDAPLRFSDGELLNDHIRWSNPSSKPIPGASVGVPQAYYLNVIFKYFVERFS